MGSWQKRFFILPEESLYTQKAKKILIYRKGQINLIEDDLLWLDYPTNRDKFFEFSKILKISKSWSESIDLYGDLDSHCLEVMFDENNIVLSVNLRLDFSAEYKVILDFIESFCKKNNFIILTDKLEVFNIEGQNE